MTEAPRTLHPQLGQVGAKPIHFIFHVPKCAGTTVHCHLSTCAPAGTYHRLKKRKGPSRFFLPPHDLAGMPDAEQLRAIGGHFIGNSIEDIFKGRQIERSILLRDPVSQFVSHYNVRMMRYLLRGRQTYSPDIAYRARQRNFVTHHILRNFLEISWPRLLSLSALEKYVAVNRLLSTFWFVGDYTRCNELIAKLGPKLGVPATAMAQNTCAEWQGRVGWTPLRVDNLTRQMVDQIRQENVLDQLLWETWRDVDQAQINDCSHRIYETPLTEFVVQESLRFVYEVRRRFHQGWKVPGGSDRVAEAVPN
jgi:hypothetical protein